MYPRPDDREVRLLGEIADLHKRARELRGATGNANSPQIRVIEGEARTKWSELRQLRAGPVSFDPATMNTRGSRR